MRVLLLLAATLAVPLAQGAYRCVDEKGVTHIGDTPPAACANVVMWEVSRSGTVLRRIDPSLTPEQVKAKEEATARAKEEAKIAAEQKRKDIALLATYSTEKEFAIATERNVEPVLGRIKSVQERQAAVTKRLQELEDEMEFYKAGKSKSSAQSKVPQKTREIPIQLVADHERATAEQATLKKNLVDYEREIVDIKAKYEADRQRWKELKTNPTLRAQATGPTKEDEMKRIHWTRGQATCGDKTVSCRRGEAYLCLKKDGSWNAVPCEAPKF